MPYREKYLEGWYGRLRGDRSTALQTARECARLADPAMMASAGAEDGRVVRAGSDPLPQNYQSVISRGANNMAGLMAMTTYPPGISFFAQSLRPDIEFNQNLDPALISQYLQALFVQDLRVMSELEQAGAESRGGVPGFRAAGFKAASQYIITGESMERFEDDLRLSTLRRDQYVVRRDSCGDIVTLIVVEQKDLKEFDEATLMKLRLSAKEIKELDNKFPEERYEDLYTLVEWHEDTKKWVTCQQCKGVEISESEDKYTRYVSTPYTLRPGHHYGTGLIEQMLGDAKSMDELALRMLQFAELGSRHLWAIDESSTTREEDMVLPNGRVIRARVSGGQIQDVAPLRTDKLSDFTVVEKTMNRVRDDVGASMLLKSEAIRNSERTTATEVVAVMRELDYATGPVRAMVAEKQQVPKAAYALHALRTRNKNPFPMADPKLVKLQAVTGLDAIARQKQAADLMEVAGLAVQMGQPGIDAIHMDVVIDALARLRGLHIPGFIKTPQERAEAQRQAIQMETQLAAQQKAVDVVGNVAQHRATTAA